MGDTCVSGVTSECLTLLSNRKQSPESGPKSITVCGQESGGMRDGGAPVRNPHYLLCQCFLLWEPGCSVMEKRKGEEHREVTGTLRHGQSSARTVSCPQTQESLPGPFVLYRRHDR